MKTLRLTFLVLFLGLLGLSRTVSAEEQGIQNHDAVDKKALAKAWFEGMGIDTKSESFAKDVFQLMTGIDQDLSPTATFTVSANNRLRMGFKF